MLLMPHDDERNDLLTLAYPLCEIGETLQGGYCELAGKIGFKGLLVCERHARQLEAHDRTALLKGIVSCLGLCLRSITLRKNKDLSVLVLAQRAQASRDLTRAREDVRRATQEEEEEEEE